MSNTELEAFLCKGVSKYCDAYDTLRYFEEQMEARLQQIGKDKTDWGRFQINKRGAFASGSGQRQDWGRYIYAFATGTLNRKTVTLEYGIWWNNPKLKKDVIFYANVNLPQDMKTFTYKKAHRDLKVDRLDRADRLYLVPESEFEIDKAFNLLLTVLLNNLP